MARESQIVELGKRKFELSNLKKVLFPDADILKAELIQYYLGLAPTVLRHLQGRPLSLVRFPDGTVGEQFFQKNRPDYAPNWIQHVRIGDTEAADGKSIDYIVATEDATLVWLANLACIEFHQMHCRQPTLEHPNYVVWDLDPPEGTPFPEVVELAFLLKEQLEGVGYHSFAKTTGRKGIHVVVPLEARHPFDKVFEAAKAIATSFVGDNKQTTTLQIKKDARQGKVLVDIYRNRPSQTIVSAYSVRGIGVGPVSMPLPWDVLADLDDPSLYNIRTVPAHVRNEGDAWEAIGAYATTLHTERKPHRKKRAVKKSRTYKTPEQLETYAQKRDFSKTSEPSGGGLAPNGSAFVVHRHHASRLHYDLRLEQDGTLKSWAVPRGLPQRPGIKRLAVHVEDHPLEYLEFEGVIPKGEYGAGPMWVFARGRYEITKNKKDSFYFRLQSPELTADYRLINTKGKDWLLERLDTAQVDWLEETIDPMLAESRSDVPATSDRIYEVKWDGIRAIISLDEGQVRIRTRSQRDITDRFPELTVPEEVFRASSAVFDGEIVCLDESGRPVFLDVMGRLQAKGERGIERHRSRHPAVCYLFDCLYLDGRPIVNDPLRRRREWLADALKRGSSYRLSEVVEDGTALFDAARQAELEGIVAKDPKSPYLPGRRSDHWLKIKVRQTTDCLIIGFTKGKGDRKKEFGALHLAQSNGEGLTYLGKVGTGFDSRTLKSISALLATVEVGDRPVKVKPVDDLQTVWLTPQLYCEVQYASVTRNGTLREPVFMRLRPDLEA